MKALPGMAPIPEVVLGSGMVLESEYSVERTDGLYVDDSEDLGEGFERVKGDTLAFTVMAGVERR